VKAQSNRLGVATLPVSQRDPSGDQPVAIQVATPSKGATHEVLSSCSKRHMALKAGASQTPITDTIEPRAVDSDPDKQCVGVGNFDLNKYPPFISLNDKEQKGDNDILDGEYVDLSKYKAFISFEGDMFHSLKDFDFAPEVAPTFDQHFPLFVTEKVLVASGGDGYMMDPRFDWIMDSGCTSHICNNKSLFTEISPMKSYITTAGNQKAPITGIGTVMIRAQLKDGEVVTVYLPKTLLSPTTPVNLVSQSKLDVNYYITTKDGYQVKRRKDDTLILEATLMEGLYVVNQVKDITLVAIPNESLALWHERLGHISVARLKAMLEGSAIGIKFLKDEINSFKCEACILGKAHRSRVSSRPIKYTNIPGRESHWDTCGPMESSVGGNKWLVIGVDIATRKITVGFHKVKSEIPNTIIRYINITNNQMGANTVKTIHSDNGGEFLGTALREWLDSQGIIHTTSAPYTPQHNGVAERALQTIVSSARCMLISSGLPVKFWAEAVRMATIIHNITPIKHNAGKSPYEASTHEVPNVSEIRTFGCRVLVREERPAGKFAVQAWNGIYMGPAQGGDGYRIYDPQTDRMGTSRNVIFQEGESRVQYHKTPSVVVRSPSERNVEDISPTDLNTSPDPYTSDESEYEIEVPLLTRAQRQRQKQTPTPICTDSDDDDWENPVFQPPNTIPEFNTISEGVDEKEDEVNKLPEQPVQQEAELKEVQSGNQDSEPAVI